MTTPTPRHMSLCTGYGGIDLALEAAFNAKTVAVADIDPGARKILAHRYPDVPNLGDITAVDWTQWAGRIDILSGGTPCQDLSHAGRRAGMTEGTRSNLWVAMREAIATIRPALVTWENVRGAYSASADSALEPCTGCVGDLRDSRTVLRALGRVLGDLSGLGYDALWYGLRASDVGAAHHRFRVFVFAWPADAASDTRRVINRNVGDSSPADTRRHDPGLRAISHFLPTVNVKNNDNRQSEGYGPNIGEALRSLPTPTVADAQGGHRSRSGSRSDELLLNGIAAAQDWREYEPAIRRQEATFGRPAPLPTEPGRNGKPRLSARFSEWLMGLPDGWITDVPGITRPESLRAAGNGVVMQQCYAAAVQFAHDFDAIEVSA